MRYGRRQTKKVATLAKLGRDADTLDQQQKAREEEDNKRMALWGLGCVVENRRVGHESLEEIVTNKGRWRSAPVE